MRVLWFTNTPSRYADSGGYNGGGWIYSLEEEITKRQDIELGVAFFMRGQPKKVKKGYATYYPIDNPFTSTFFRKIRSTIIASQNKERVWLQNFLKVIYDFKPDLIEVFGSEQPFGQVAQYVDIPVVLHIQGILTPIYNAFLPPFISKHNYVWQDINLWHAYKRYREIENLRRNGFREIDMIRHIQFFIGRTVWDRRLTLLYNPKAKYFYGNEILRDVFYLDSKRRIPPKPKIISTLSSPLYKGYETVLKTAKLLTNTIGLNFEWLIYGNINPCSVEKELGICHDDVHVKFMGVATAEQLKAVLTESTAYVHLSYIDNSPNSICEAQNTGVPVIATNVGGIPSLVKDRETGFLVPANDPYQTAYVINQLANDKELNERIGNNAKKTAMKRHDKTTIVNSLVNTYKTILNEKSNIK